MMKVVISGLSKCQNKGEDIYFSFLDSKNIPAGVKHKVQLNSTLEVISEIIKLECKSEQGRRYGHAVLDIAREINRYMHPEIKYAGDKKEHIKKELKDLFIKALG